MKRVISGISAAALLLCGCSSSTASTESSASASASASAVTQETAAVTTDLSMIDNTKWQYNSDDDVYYQIGIQYCSDPADSSYETLAIFVPGSYFNATDNGDGTYTVTVNTEAEVNGYTASTAPIVMPVNTPGYSAQEALTEYQSFTEYTGTGMVYVHAGCRGRDAGAPAGVTDMKAAIRYLRYSASTIAGNTDQIFVFGMSGGGAQAAILGSSGNSDLYTPYLEAIGAVMGVSDAVQGVMAWCPITNLDTADESYEWMMGSTRSGLSDEEQSISDALAEAYAEWVNSADLKDANGNVLTLEASDDGIYQAGSYYDYLKSVIEESLNNFLSDTEFPYDASSSNSMSGGPGGGGMPDGQKPDGAPNGQTPDGTAPDASASADTSSSASSDMANAEQNDGIARNSTSSGLSLTGTYETAQDYIDALNANGTWVTYDADTNTAAITSIADFVKAMKTASKGIAAFDQLDASQGENTLFGYGDGNGAHFDSTLAEIVNGTDYASAFEEDLAKTDSVGNTVETRLNMYTPLYYLLDSYDGYQTADVASYWRIRTGLSQSDTALTTEVNLALALQQYSGVKSVDFATVWGLGHTTAERTGDYVSNFIAWIEECTK